MRLQHIKEIVLMKESASLRGFFILLIVFVFAIPVIVLKPEQYTLEIFISTVIMSFTIAILDYIHFSRMIKFAEEARKTGIDI